MSTVVSGVAGSVVDGLVVVDKPSGWTSHDVVGRMRRLCRTRKVGHGGTLDPMATGVLIIGVGKATKLLGRITASDKSYTATIRLGVSTLTDDAEGEVLTVASVAGLADERARIDEQVAALTGPILQRPSSVSAIKVDGKRSYARVRSGETVRLEPRPVTVSEFEVLSVVSTVAQDREVLDLDVRVTVSSGTYVRALARDLGEALGTGGHLTALRRTRVGPFTLAQASTLEQLENDLQVLTLAEVCSELFASVVVGGEDARVVGHGGRLAWPAELAEPDVAETVAIFTTDGQVLALAECRECQLAPVVVWASG
ncbi:MAG: tRNA pseudouridine(55) synthase TruB [Actinomycetes bacterium]